MRRAGVLLLIVACRATEPPPARSSPLVVQPKAVDGGALVTVPGPPANEAAPQGCPSAESVSADAKRLARALHERFAVEWETSVENERIHATPMKVFEEERDTAARVFETVQATFPDLALGEVQIGGHRMSVFHCRAQLVKDGVDVRTRHAVCLETKGLVVEEVRVDRSRRLPAFAALLVVTEEQAQVTAVDHTRVAQKVEDPHVGRPQLVADCDDRGRASSLVWVVDVEVGWGIVTVAVDARTRRVVEAKVHRL